MPDRIRQIFAFSGVLQTATSRPSFDLVRHALSLTGIEAGAPVRACYLPTAVGDDPANVAGMAESFGAVDGLEFSALRLFTQPSV